MQIRVGTDVQSIDDVRASIQEYGARYVSRLFTTHEIECCGGIDARAAGSYAARFAAKEAVIKLLQPRDVVPGWRSIEIRRLPGGAVAVQLEGTAADLAAAASIEDISLSMSHDAGVAIATAVGIATMPS
jgi:holo-[acyl-carrier protein] synthase